MRWPLKRKSKHESGTVRCFPGVGIVHCMKIREMDSMSTVTGKQGWWRIYLLLHVNVSYFRDDGTVVEQPWPSRLTDQDGS